MRNSSFINDKKINVIKMKDGKFTNNPSVGTSVDNNYYMIVI